MDLRHETRSVARARADEVSHRVGGRFGVRARRTSWAAVTSCVVAAGFALSTPLSAQGITGAVRHVETSAPLSGVLISVLDLDGERVRGVLTDATGRYVVRVPMGRYRVRAERIGLRAETVGPVDVVTLNLVPQDVRMAERAVEIPGLVVDSRVQACRLDQEQAVRIQRWWREVRTALDVSAVMQGQRFADFLIERFERDWDADLETIVATSASTEIAQTSRPFVAEEAEILHSRGFVHPDGLQGRSYFAPDAEVLLSDVFLEDHCFSISDDEGLENEVGLRFEPNRERELTDINGTLWVDTTTAELRRLEFAFEEIDELPDNDAGGLIEFDYLANGAWIVSNWYIRMPRIGLRSRRRAELILIGYRDIGARVTETGVTGDAAAGAVGMITGTVYDSIAGGGLAGATVWVLGTSRRTSTDGQGRFTLTGVPVGTQAVTFTHPLSSSWGLGAPFARVEVFEGRAGRVSLALPAFRGAAQALCMGSGQQATTVLTGHLLTSTGQPHADVEMEFAWPLQIEVDRQRQQAITVRTGSDGRFIVCTVPDGVPVTVRARVGGRWQEAFTVRTGAEEISYRVVALER
jgi:hypothetical protein